MPPILSTHHFETGAFPLKFFCKRWVGMEGRVIIGKGAGQWGGQAAIMMCGCDGGWNGGDGSLKRSSNRSGL